MNICVYGASSTQITEDYISETEKLGEKLAQRGDTLVYGAGGAGLMGAAARGFHRGGGYVVGVVPRFLQVDGVIYDRCDEIIWTEDMRSRKQIMDERAEAFIITPGGVGTCDEFFEMFTLKQLGRHRKPLIIFNINGYFDTLLRFMEEMVEKDFMRERSLHLMKVADTADEVIAALNAAVGEAEADISATKFV